MDRMLTGIPVDDLRVISVKMESDYADVGIGGTNSVVSFDVGERDTRNDDGVRTLGLSLGVSMDTTAGPDSKKVFSADVRVGCTVHPTGDETDDELADAAIETCVGYARSVIMSLADSSLAGMRLSFPYVRAVDVLAIQRRSDQNE